MGCAVRSQRSEAHSNVGVREQVLSDDEGLREGEVARVDVVLLKRVEVENLLFGKVH